MLSMLFFFKVTYYNNLVQKVNLKLEIKFKYIIMYFYLNNTTFKFFY